ncbi:MAG: phytanoyl-CoA dioxygenase family protein [Candidatus Latescibacterota bacterium]
MTDLLSAGLTYRGEEMDGASDSLGELRRSDNIAGDVAALRSRMEEVGYLFLPGLLYRDEVLTARQEVLRRLAAAGIVDDENHPLMDGVVRPDQTNAFSSSLATDNQPLMKVLYDGQGPMIAFYERFFGGRVRHFDYTWFRAKTPGVETATTPHYDVVYMGRGTKNLWTSWTPLGDVPLEHGGLIVLEGSHRQQELRRTYGATDVDKYCENEGDAARLVAAAREEGRELTADESQVIHWNSSGQYSNDAIAARRELGGRWLTAEYAAGDLLIFSMYTMHASSDNRSNRIRLSSDSRYQLASDPVDERWIGDDPPIHGIRAKRGMIC